MAKGKRVKEESEFHSGVLLVVILIILLVVVGFFEVKNYKLKKATDDLGRLVDKIENEISVTENSISGSMNVAPENVINQEMTDEEKAELERLRQLNNEVSNEIISTTSTNSTNNNTDEDKLIEEKISTFIKLYFDYRTNLEKFFKDLGLNIVVDKTKVDDKGMYLSDVSFQDYTNKMLELMSGEMIEDKFVNVTSFTSKVYFDTKYVKEDNINNKIDINSIDFSKKDGNSYIYLVKVNEHYEGKNDEIWYKVVTEKVNGKYLILNIEVKVVK